MRYGRFNFGPADFVVMAFMLIAMIAFGEAILWAIGKAIYG